MSAQVPSAVWPWPFPRGVYAAALTPMDARGRVLPQEVGPWLHRLAAAGVHGALLLGTTGEGPSLAPEERLAVMRAAAQARPRPDFGLLAGTGTPALEETLALTRAAFDLGFDGVVVLPPYYFRGADDAGLFAWFAAVLQRAVPADGALLAYHIPQVSGVGLSLELLARLQDAFPARFAGLKDSSGDPAWAEALGQRFAGALAVFTGNDGLVCHAHAQGAAGAITALGNLVGALLRRVWDGCEQGQAVAEEQARLARVRARVAALGVFPAGLKALLPRLGGPTWGVKLPLRLPSAEAVAQVLPEVQALLAAPGSGERQAPAP